MKSSEKSEFAKKDALVALLLALAALAAYVRTLAPDILYSDSAEFQCLTYTFGITHSTGYPTYLLLARLLGFLPIHSPAWRVNLLSAVCAALTVGGIYLLARQFTRSRVGAALGAVALGISYTFWAQAVIAEVYTPGMAFLVTIMLLLFHWQAEPANRNRSLFAAALVAGIGFGVHASVWLVAPPAIALIVWTLAWRRATWAEWLRSLFAGLAGASLGLALFAIAFFAFDRLNSPASFINTTMEPSRVFWQIPAEAFNSPVERLKMIVLSAQWDNALFPGGDFSFTRAVENFGDRLWDLEFPPPVLLFAIIGLVVMLIRAPLSAAFYPVAFLFSAFLILNYRVGDKYVFYLSLYIPLTVAAGTGMGFALEWIQSSLETVPGRSLRLLYLLPMLFFVTLVVQPTAAIRWQALRVGAADFVTESYPYPVESLKEPRIIAQTRLAGAAENAVFVLDWRGLFSTAYLAYVEKGMTNTLFLEAMPAGNKGEVASTLVAQIKEYLAAGRPVYTDQKFPGLEKNFRLVPAQGNLYRLKLRQ